MRIEIEIPDEFEVDYKNDKFEDFFKRVLCDIEKGTLCGIYEKEIAEMFIKAFEESKPAYNVDKVVAELESKRDYRELTNYYGDVIGVRNIDTIKIDKAIDIVRRGGVE